MVEVNSFFNYIASLLTKQPLEFDRQKYIHVNMLSCLRSIEKYHTLILTIQKRSFETDFAEKYLLLRTNVKKPDNILVYCNETSNKSPAMKLNLNFQKKTVVVESKKKLLNILNEIDLNQRLLLGKIKREIEQAQLKLTKLHNALDLSSDVHNRLQLQNTVNNTKVNEMFALMNSMECQLKTGITYFKLSINDLDKSITDIFKDTFEEVTNMKQKPSKCLNDSDLGLLNTYAELKKNINSINQMNVLKPLKTILENVNLFDIDWTDFLKTYNCRKEKLLFKINQNSNMLTIINTFMNNLNNMEQTLNEDLRNIVLNINNILNERIISNQNMNKLNAELEELKKNKNIIMNISNQKSNKLKSDCIEIINNLENETHESVAQLTVTIENGEQFNDRSRHSDSLFDVATQNYIKQLDVEYKSLRSSEDEAIFLKKRLKTTRDEHNEILIRRKEIIADQFNRTKSAMEATIMEKRRHIVETRGAITSYKNIMKMYKDFMEQLKDINKSKENANNDLLSIYQCLMFQNHGKDLEQLKDEEIELTSYINLYNKELDELNKDDKHIDDYSKFVLLKMNDEIKNLDEKLQQVENANASLKVKFHRKK